MFLALSGCATGFSARGSGGVSARVSTDPRVGDLAGVLAAGADALSQVSVSAPEVRAEAPSVSVNGGVSARSQGAATTEVHTLGTATSETGVGGVSTTTTSTTTARVTQSTTVAGSVGVVGSAPAVVFGRVTNVTCGRIETEVATEVVGGGAITLVGAPMVEGLTVVEGSVTVGEGRGVLVRPPRGRAGASARARVTTTVTTTTTTARVGADGSARWTLTGGAVLLQARDGRRWRAEVEGGALELRTEGTNPSGNTVWSPVGGELRVRVTAQGDSSLEATAPSSAVPVVNTDGVSARVLASLDLLLTATTEGTEALRQAAAVQTILREARGSTPELFHTPITGRSLVLLVDVSYSMADVDPGASDLSVGSLRPTKLDVARAELVKVLASLPGDVRVNVVAFSATVRPLWSEPRTLDQAGLEEAVRWIAGLRPADETDPVAAIQAVAGQRPDQLVLISDGRPTHRPSEAQAMLSLAGSLGAGVRLDVVGVGPDQDRPFLTALAARGGGTLRLR
ncbi:MAG: VWA domain-containing protein [Deltaproteobacteria bacterium]|nr:VWA domain-containing protein [Deltaproteobacteria bacterium]